MKTFLLLFAATLSLYGVEWRDYKSALKEQKVTGKPIMLDVVREGCHYCSNMEKNVFDDPEMSKWIEKRFIPVKIDQAKEKVPLGIKVYFNPSFFFIKNGKVVKKVPGSWNIQDFKDLTEKIK